MENVHGFTGVLFDEMSHLENVQEKKPCVDIHKDFNNISHEMDINVSQVYVTF